MGERRLIEQITIGERHRKDLGDLDDLKASITSLGLLQPIVITAEGKLIAGGRRLEAYRALGIPDIDVHVVEGLADAVALLRAERDENTCRKDMVPSELIALGRAIEELERPKAAERKAQAPGMPRGEKKSDVSSVQANGTEPDPPEYSDVREAAAKAVGMSTATYTRVRQISNAAEGFEESRGKRSEVSPERQAESQAALELIDRVHAGEKIRPGADARPLTISKIYEDWKGHKINRGDQAPAEFRRPAEAASFPTGANGRRLPQRPQREKIESGIRALNGLAMGFETAQSIDSSISAEEAASWERDLSKALRVFSAFRKKLKEHAHAIR